MTNDKVIDMIRFDFLKTLDAPEDFDFFVYNWRKQEGLYGPQVVLSGQILNGDTGTSNYSIGLSNESLKKIHFELNLPDLDMLKGIVLRFRKTTNKKGTKVLEVVDRRESTDSMTQPAKRPKK